MERLRIDIPIVHADVHCNRTNRGVYVEIIEASIMIWLNDRGGSQIVLDMLLSRNGSEVATTSNISPQVAQQLFDGKDVSFPDHLQLIAYSFESFEPRFAATRLQLNAEARREDLLDGGITDPELLMELSRWPLRMLVDSKTKPK